MILDGRPQYRNTYDVAARVCTARLIHCVAKYYDVLVLSDAASRSFGLCIAAHVVETLEQR